MAELTTAMHKAEYAEQSFEEIGFTQDGPIETIRALNAQRDQWHDLAAEMTSLHSMNTIKNGLPNMYIAPSLETLFFDKKQIKVGADTKRRLKLSAERLAQAYDTPEAAEELTARKIARQQDQLDSMSESMHNQAGAVFLMFNLALRSDKEGAAMRSKNFCALPLDSQRMLLNNAVTAADRADERAASERGISESEYDRISLTSIKLTRDVRTALTSPKFTVQAHVDDSVNVQRQYKSAKEIAAIHKSVLEATM